jgi:glycosyltransferase involved in cell wall biosynthesis
MDGETSVKSALQQHPKVAILLATYNGARYIEPQIRSLGENTAPFTLHWLDDHSTDDTREAVRAAALSSGIELVEWHQTQRHGATGAFFKLLECVEADFYLFCDQDDIWQPGKIDVTVANLGPDAALPALCFSDPLIFSADEPGVLHRLSDMAGAKPAVALRESRIFMSAVALGHTQGFTRPLREIFLRHKEIAREYAFGHDGWMYGIAVASGIARMLYDVPTTLYRRHRDNVSATFFGRGRGGISRSASKWPVQQLLRRVLSRQAAGFILASPTLPPGPKLERLLEIARLVATLDRRQSPAALFRLARRGAIWPNWRLAISLATVCLCFDAKD